MKGFVDFEFNNLKGIKGNEIISIGCVILDDDLQEVGNFSSLVKPIRNQRLGEIVSNLTGISQEDVDSADDFKTVCVRFIKFLSPFGKMDFYCWGDADNNALKHTCSVNDYFSIMNYTGNIIDIQKTISSSITVNNMPIRRRLKLEFMREL